MSPIVLNGSSRSMPPIWAAAILKSSACTDSNGYGMRTRCSACTLRCADCIICAELADHPQHFRRHGFDAWRVTRPFAQWRAFAIMNIAFAYRLLREGIARDTDSVHEA